jgi:NADH-quinone oxidoreductase subunit H
MSGLLPLLLVTLFKSAVLLFVILTAAAYLVFAERRLVAAFQIRMGPNRVGPFGLLQPLADVIKLITKEPAAPGGRARAVYLLAPMIAIAATLAALAVIPFNGPNDLIPYGRQIGYAIANVNVGVLYIFAVTSLGVYGIFLGGWASNSKYSLLGALRSSAQMISYEMSLGLSLVGVFILAGSLNLQQIVLAQRGSWFLLLQPLAFVLYLIAAVAETNRAPFDLPEADTELVSGYFTEYSGMRFAAFFIGEYTAMIVVSCIATTVFLGGWLPPWPLGFTEGVIPGVFWFALKVSFFLFLYIWVRATLPRLRYDRLMQIGWKALLPLSLLNVLVTATVVVLTQR